MNFEEGLVEGARYWAQYMSPVGYFDHCIPASLCDSGNTATPPPTAYASWAVAPGNRDVHFGAMVAGFGENIARGFATGLDAEAGFMSEQANCPNDSPVNCAPTDVPLTGHFINIITPSYTWIGLGESVSMSDPSGYYRYYVQDFETSPWATGTSAHARSAAAAPASGVFPAGLSAHR